MLDTALIESPSLREHYVQYEEVLDKVKPLTLLPDNLHITIEMASNYYEVDRRTIERLIERHREELLNDGLKVLPVKEFVNEIKRYDNISPMARRITLLPRRAILRLGMLLRDSEVAKQVRDYLLNVEVLTPKDIKQEALAIMNKTGEELMAYINNRISSLEQHIDEEFNKRLPAPALKTLSAQMEDLINTYHRHYGEIPGGKERYTIFYDQYSIWNPLPSHEEMINACGNVKQYLISYRFEDVQFFVNGVVTGRIVKTNGGKFIDLQGYDANKVEFPRILQEFSYQCVYCGVTNNTLVPDHIIPRSLAGSTNLVYNIVPACKKCNTSKSYHPLMKWYPKQPFYDPIRLRRIEEHYNSYYPSGNIFHLTIGRDSHL